MAKAGEREKMQTSGLGNDPSHLMCAPTHEVPLSCRQLKAQRTVSRGFTLIELLVVLLIMALVTSLATLSLGSSTQQHLNEEATRLIAQLESTKAQARASSLNVSLGLGQGGFYFVGLSDNPLLQTAYPWLYPNTQAQVQSGPVLLGPEALTAPSLIVLSDALDPKLTLSIASDGLRPFQVISR
jgi:general secretion pathway protein H